MIYFLLFLISFFVSLFFICLARFFGRKFKFFDIVRGDLLKIHKNPVTYLGGLAMFLVFGILLLFFSYFKEFLSWRIGGIILAGFFLFLIGFWDDLRWKKIGVSTIKKFLFLVLFSLLATIVLVWPGIEIQFFPIVWLNSFLLFLCILGLINAINFEDGIDGLAGGLVGISLIGFIILSVVLGNNLTLLFSLVLLGTILGFLFFNFPPAKIFMGDSGAYFLGFILAVLAALFIKPLNFASVFGVTLIIGFPIFDTGIAIARRVFQKKSPFVGDRAHFYDRMIKRGFSIKKTNFVSYFFQLISVIMGVIIYLCYV